jgi:signal transduction histidine kinase
MAMLLYHLRVINKEREQQEKFLIRQSKMASMGEVIALIAHQWRQPLSAINGIVLNIDMDYRRKNLPMERLDEHLNKIEETTAYLSRTINDFTDFFSKNKQKDEFEIIEVINQSIKLTAISSQKNIDLIYNEKKSIHLTGYKSELIQSILIVLNNAIYATLKNLSYTTRGKIIIRTYHSGKNLFISIEDNGGGIDPKHLKIIFDPYFTTKDKAHGTGLGLYILKLIVEDSMNGKLFVSNGKEGAIFIIRVPLHL